MPHATSTIPPEVLDFPYKLLEAFDKAQKQVTLASWDYLISFLSKHWFSVGAFLFVIFVISFIWALLGRWGILGSVLYNYLYFGTLFVFGLVFGPEIFTGFFIKIFCIILYVVCFLLVGNILEKLGLKK